MANKNKKDEEVEVDRNAWMITFSDLLTLMLTFFVMLLTMSTVNPGEVKEAFSVFDSLYYEEGDPESQTIESYGLMETSGVSPMEGEQFSGLVNLPLKYVSARRMSKDADELESLLINFTNNAEKKFSNYSEQEINELKKIWVKKAPEGIIVYLPDLLIFKQGDNSVSPRSAEILKLLGNWAQKSPYLVKIEGHADNWELSVRRATNAMRYFMENKFIEDSKKISAFGYGEFKPLVPDDSLKNREKNRRLEIIFKKPAA